jgi:hypothetical protein
MRELRRRWFGLLVAGWSVLLLMLAFGAYGGDATVAEQRDIAAARAAVDRATADLVRASGQHVAVQVGGYDFVADCRISLVRGGVQHRRLVRLLTAPGAESELVELIGRQLPEDYRAAAYESRGRHRLSASGAGFVSVAGTTGPTGRGVLQVTVGTGCRPVDGPVTTLRTPPTRTEMIRVDEVLDLLGVPRHEARDPRWRTETIECGTGELRSVEFTSGTPPDRPLGDFADLAPPDATVLVREARQLAYRQGAMSVVATTANGRLRVTTTAVDC